MSAKVIHPEHLHQPFAPITDAEMSDYLFGEEMALREAVVAGREPRMSIVIQSCLDSPKELENIFDDLAKQEYPPERLERIVVGDVSHDAAVLARSRGAEVIQVERDAMFRARMPQAGLEASQNNLVYTTIGHVAMPHNRVLVSAAAWGLRENISGAYGIALPGRDASVWERGGARLLGARRIAQTGSQRTFNGMGMLATDSSVVKRDLALEVGGYPPAYGAGGADGQLGQKLDALIGGKPYRVMRDPMGMSVIHTHGLGFGQSLQQVKYWGGMGKPREYDAAAIDTWHPRGGL